MQRYEKYKDSGIEWLGEIPEHWEVKPGFTVLKERKDKNAGMKSNNVLSLSYGRIIEKPAEKLTGLVPENFETYQLVSPGDIIFRPTDLQNDKVSLRTGLSKFKGIITSAYINLQPINANPEFLHYFLHTTDTNKVIYGLGSGLRQNISYLDFKRFMIGTPPLQEQKAIANFLDDKCEKIDAAVGLKEQQIEKLKELRQITIHNAVTKGFYHTEPGEGSLPMKDSGIDWIGEIPKHWEVKRLKAVTSFVNRGVTPSYIEDSDYYVVNQATFSKGVFDLKNIKYTNESSEGYARSKGKLLKDDLLIASTGGGVLGKVAMYDQKIGNFIADSHVTIVRTDSNNVSKYFYYFFVINYSLINGVLAQGSTNQTELQRGWLLDFRLPVPPLAEQLAIVTYLEEQTSKIDKAITQKQEQIAKLKEYKQSLINEVVTGKIKVTV